jgi:hypothetical protein
MSSREKRCSNKPFPLSSERKGRIVRGALKEGANNRFTEANIVINRI